ncbi:MCE family protein [Gordonia amarae]|uniref:Mce family protein n=2 Tax=Gordonia amarae TaxID=36821 RepID=G7GP53_9ACTN|nr:MlaD family protein [Gordonia amarae]MCS3878035.1 phospholipid/cholesterol/gamma-HCH transport system substrate-binding protein [Gordonia amarae]QHN16731.1 MCE family protein [Gordonia amarae]QHN21256.1 MCE family protein [Gordonia amarae]QHN30110.1 MCE family protein [Gordonia amarae]QHN38884.1 MCE family protein [Gordonia amarae]
MKLPTSDLTAWYKRLPAGTLQFVIFLAIAAFVIPYGINFIAGPEGFGAKLTLKAQMRDAFGLTKGTGVTVRGVDVGTVSEVKLSPDGKAADIKLVLRGNVKIPKNSYMQVTMATMAGIQSVDIIPESSTGPYLKSGDTVSAPADRQPQQMDTIISDAAKVLRSIGDGDLSTVGDEIYTALGKNEKTLQTLLTNGSQLATLVRRNAPMLRGIFDEWLTVLDAMSDNTASFERGMKTTATFTDQLDAQQPVFVYLLDRSPKGLDHARALFDKYRGTFGGVLANLTVVEPIISDRQAALTTGLKTIPRGMEDLRSIVKNGRADFSLIATQGPVCMFYDEPRSSVGDFTVAAPNLARYCPPTNSSGQRGAVNAPRPNNLGTSTWTQPGQPSGPAVVDDPVLIPNGTELLDWWRKLEERAKNGN